MEILVQVYPVKEMRMEQVLDFVTAAGRYSSDIFLCNGESKINGKGLLGTVVYFMLNKTQKVSLYVRGIDSSVAAHELSQLLLKEDNKMKIKY
ncbi:HPr family phosphocarrier protein [Alkalihalobacterium bogoriense]|uniref:HPr family phosphocarrier protein n=1 Tax=Alkalihalobacterium bogoriense TaxID=246272 RepID=UPI00047CA1A9|nr:HPr family phosphocarrier protein [Alkalihalobacterium bogoriense]